MKKMRTKTPLLMAAFFCLSLSAASKQKEITIFFDNSYPPYMSLKNGHSDGIYPLLIKKIFEKMNRPLKIEMPPWGRAVKFSEQEKGGLGGLYWNKKRNKIYDYSDSIFEEKINLFYKKGKKINFKNLIDLKGKIIGLNRGWSYGEKVDLAIKRNLFSVEIAADNNANFKKLIRDRVDCTFADELSAKIAINKNILKGKIVSSPNPVVFNKAFIAFSKKMKLKKLLEKFNKTLKAMRKDGSYKAVIDSFIVK